MFFLVTGSSGAGKSTARRLITRELAPETECIELGHVVTMPPWPTISWRQQAAETVVQRALELQAEGRHLLPWSKHPMARSAAIERDVCHTRFPGQRR